MNFQIDTDVKQVSNTVNPSTEDKNDSTASSENDSVEEFEVEKVKDYKWCRATVRLFLDCAQLQAALLVVFLSFCLVASSLEQSQFCRFLVIRHTYRVSHRLVPTFDSNS